jgi:hypothetical protein
MVCVRYDGTLQAETQWRRDRATNEQVTNYHFELQNGSQSLLISGFFPPGHF